MSAQKFSSHSLPPETPANAQVHQGDYEIPMSATEGDPT